MIKEATDNSLGTTSGLCVISLLIYQALNIEFEPHRAMESCYFMVNDLQKNINKHYMARQDEIEGFLEGFKFSFITFAIAERYTSCYIGKCHCRIQNTTSKIISHGIMIVNCIVTTEIIKSYISYDAYHTFLGLITVVRYSLQILTHSSDVIMPQYRSVRWFYIPCVHGLSFLKTVLTALFICIVSHCMEFVCVQFSTYRGLTGRINHITVSSLIGSQTLQRTMTRVGLSHSF